MKLNQPELLPPVECPLVILVDGLLVRAERTSHIEHRDRSMEYRLVSGEIITGRFAWSYP